MSCLLQRQPGVPHVSSSPHYAPSAHHHHFNHLPFFYMDMDLREADGGQGPGFTVRNLKLET
jgi:hypothetical protein